VKRKQIEVASVQLEKALRLFQGKDYVCSLTLAGAAEEILGKLAQEEGLRTALDEEADLVMAMKWLPPGAKARKQYIAFLNLPRNSLKHRISDPASIIPSKWQTAAADMLHRACLNYRRATGDFPSSETFHRFLQTT
jgi:hypothetical protein